MRSNDVYVTVPARNARIIRATADDTVAPADCVLVSVAGGMQTLRIYALVMPGLFNACPCAITAKLLHNAYEAHLQFEHEEKL